MIVLLRRRPALPRAFIWTAIGLCVYFPYSRRRSVVGAGETA